MVLILQRRHSPKCPDRAKGVIFLKCRGKCRFWAIGEGVNRERFSLKTRDLARAQARLVKENEMRAAGGVIDRQRKGLAEAIEAFHAQGVNNAEATGKKYRRVLRYLEDYCRSRGITAVEGVETEVLDGYRLSRLETLKGRWSWTKELEILAAFFRFCIGRKWISTNPADSVKRPKIGEANDIEPYTQDEMVRMFAACHTIGRGSYERRRAYAMLAVLRFTGLRVSDVVTLRAEHVAGTHLVKKTVKSQETKTVRIEILPELRAALDSAPHPRGAAADSTLIFASGGATMLTEVKKAWRTLRAVFRRAGVEGAHPHRFRHTLASEILGKGGTIEIAASVLGDSPATVRRHYAKYLPEAQLRQDAKLREVHGTNLTQADETVRTC